MNGVLMATEALAAGYYLSQIRGYYATADAWGHGNHVLLPHQMLLWISTLILMEMVESPAKLHTWWSFHELNML